MVDGFLFMQVELKLKSIFTGCKGGVRDNDGEVDVDVGRMN
jgi:hypothetical protein